MMNTKFNIKRCTSLSMGTTLLVISLAYKCITGPEDSNDRITTAVVNAINAVANNPAAANAINIIVKTAVDAADKHTTSYAVAFEILNNDAVSAAVANVIHPNKVVTEVANAAAGIAISHRTNAAAIAVINRTNAAVIAVINCANITAVPAVTAVAAFTVVMSTATNAAGNATAIIAAIEAAIKAAIEAAIAHNATTGIITAAARVFVDAIENPGPKMRRDRMMRSKKYPHVLG